MKLRIHIDLPLIVIACLALATVPVTGQTVVFSDDFESPDVEPTYAVANTSRVASSDWVRATKGFKGSNNGIVDEGENGGANFTDPVGSQAYALRYTNSGVTTAAGVIGNLTGGATYTVTFDVVVDGWNGGSSYNAGLVTFAGGANRAEMDQNMADQTSAVLKTASGTATGTYQQVTLTYTSDATEATLGQDVALRFDGATNAANIDNVVVEVELPLGDTDPPLPDPLTFAVEPRPISATEITMTATTATDVTGPVEYFFENITATKDSGWISSETWVDSDLTDGQTYAYRVKARDAVTPTPNETGWSGTFSAVAEADTVAPTPDAMTFLTVPFVSAAGAVSMEASVATDAYPTGPVEYSFENTSTGATRDWGTSRHWTETGLNVGATYAYRVRARDGAGNETAWSAEEFVTVVGITVLLGEGFELPDAEVSQPGSTDGTLPDGWVGSSVGFKASHRGIVDEAQGAFTDPVGEQAFAFRYSSTGLTSADGAIGGLVLGATYTVSFDIVNDGSGSKSGYNVGLLAFDAGAARSDTQALGNGALAVLASAGGSGSTDGAYTRIAFSFTADPVDDAALVGKDLAVRLVGGFEAGIIDNVQVSSTGGDSFANWIADFPGAASDPSFAGDPDGDGSGNGLENFFGTDPGVFTPGVIAGMMDGTSASFSHPQGTDPVDDITAPVYRWSKDLAVWYGDGDTAPDGTRVDFTILTDTPEPGTTTVTADVNEGSAEVLFLTVSVSQIVPPPPLLEENFDAAAALPDGWTSTGPVNGTNWEVGTPSGVPTAPTAANSPANCAGTNIAGYYTENADVSLISPGIEVPAGSGATLEFQQFIDTDLVGATTDKGSVRILDADNGDTPIAGLEITDIEGDGSAGWTGVLLNLPAGEVGGRTIKVEFRFVSDAGAVVEDDVWGGFYVDDVVVTEVAP